jgi:endonuclease/exonuclease/phosphatase family metal-dependent hydrolase
MIEGLALALHRREAPRQRGDDLERAAAGTRILLRRADRRRQTRHKQKPAPEHGRSPDARTILHATAGLRQTVPLAERGQAVQTGVMPRLLFLLLLLLASPALAQPEIKLATWNIAWLTLKPANHPDLPPNLTPRRESDFALLRGYAQRLDADIVALQEIDGEAAAARVFDTRHYLIHLTDEADIQRPGFAIRRTLRVTRNPDLAALDIRAGARRSLRRGADVTVELPNGARLRLLSVHLNAGCREDPFERGPPECESLARQARIIAEWVAARRREGMAFAVLGDFNRRMTERDDFLRLVEAGEPLARPTAGFASPCWATARGGSPFISHMLLGGPARDWIVPNSLSVLVYAERDRAFRDRLSDHCPVSVRLRPS